MESPGGVALKCLIADDAANARELFRFVLENLQVQTIEASNGEEAIKLAFLHRPAFIVLDIGMPEKDGYAVVAALRASPLFASTPIIALTAAIGETEPSTIRAAGFTSYLAKPIRPAVLREVVQELITSFAS